MHSSFFGPRLVVVLVALTWLLPASALAQTAPQVDRFVAGAETSGLYGVAYRSADGHVFGADRANGTIYRWPGMLAAADGSSVSATSSFAAPANVGGLTLNAAEDRLFVVSGSESLSMTSLAIRSVRFSPLGEPLWLGSLSWVPISSSLNRAVRGECAFLRRREVCPRQSRAIRWSVFRMAVISTVSTTIR